jgi:hypothetical protein
MLQLIEDLQHVEIDDRAEVMKLLGEDADLFGKYCLCRETQSDHSQLIGQIRAKNYELQQYSMRHKRALDFF